MFIQTENTPNPNAVKFLPGKIISDKPIYYSKLEEAVSAGSALVLDLFYIEGVEAIFLGYDFITITKSEDSDWELLKPEILTIMNDRFLSGLGIFDDEAPRVSSIDTEGMSDIEKQIVEIIETRVRPSVAMDGGDIVYRGFENGVVKLELRGACSGCPSSTVTLKDGIENMLKHFVPEVESVEAV